MRFSFILCWFILCGICLVGALVPFVGAVFILLMPFMLGTLAALGLLAVFLDVLIRRLPVAFVVLPVGALVWYYGLVVFDQLDLRRIRDEIAAQNPMTIAAFDPSAYDLVLPDAQRFVRLNAIATAYDEKQFAQISALNDDDCSIVADFIKTVPGSWADVSSGIFGAVCVVTVPGTPARQTVTVTRQHTLNNDSPQLRTSLLRTSGLQLSGANGPVMTLIDRVSVDAYPPIPVLLLGCMLMTEGQPQCYFGPKKRPQTLEVINPSIDRDLYPEPENILLGIPARKKGEGPFADRESVMAAIRTAAAGQ
ncbi:hypothetical protein PDO_1080 [Rhizobium sp. PDO1-076]|uniref:hypothetical protein n=1 Tax=Rhizobium sp. PDO1-076 TaxID=1125979 RepID=UPI00024E3565|nr:hypothetical protein [Rhizobium sp. PDO1-076]EHS53370.1 hypothetical protein PDO_1080 [Rhizobium sp. PDO1-076]